MRKLLTILSAFLFVGTVYAANVDVRIEEPKSATNQNSFPIGFVALDIQNRAMTVKCFKQGPAEASFTQFGSDINLAAGGNSGNCQVTSGVFSTNGTYQIKVEATAGGDSATDQVDVVYDTSGPGDPRDYSKEKVNSCDYKIHFKTADDSGQTVKVEVYRSENTSFSVDNGTRVGTVLAGSNEAHDFPNTAPDCNKTYYYAVRAFDAAGNGSGVVGDSVVKTTVTNPTTTTPVDTGAIAAGTAGNIFGAETGVPQTPTEEPTPESTPGDVQGEMIDSEDEQTASFLSRFWWLLVLVGLGLLALVYARRNQTQV